MRQHVSEDRIIVSGIPVRDVFHQHRWHWDETIHGRKNVLIMGGGLGMGSMKEALIELDRLNSVDDLRSLQDTTPIYMMNFAAFGRTFVIP